MKLASFLRAITIMRIILVFLGKMFRLFMFLYSYSNSKMTKPEHYSACDCHCSACEENHCEECSCCDCGESYDCNNCARIERIVPNFKLTMYNPHSQEIENKTVKDYRNKWLVLFFYPADFTFVCPTELKDLNQKAEEIRAMGDVEVFGVSVDSVFSHKSWLESEEMLKDFQFNMISDRNTVLSRYFGILNTATGNAERGTFIISPDGVLKTIEIHTDAVGRSAKELVRKLYGLKFVTENKGHACPASWENNMKTMQPNIKNAGHAGATLS